MKNLLFLFAFSSILISSVFAQDDFCYQDYTLNELWKATASYFNDWYKYDFDDSNWDNAVVSLQYTENPPYLMYSNNSYYRMKIADGYKNNRYATKVLIKIIADDDFELYVNENLVAKDVNGGIASPPSVFDVTSIWRHYQYTTGQHNIVAIKAINTQGGGSIRAVVRCFYKTGATNLQSPIGNSIKDFTLDQNFPNPFNPITTINYQVPKSGMVSLSIYNSLGQQIKALVNTYQTVGEYRTVWDGRNDQGQPVAAGSYFYRLFVDGKVETKKMSLVK